ncbi:MAG: hypothetical protein LBM59_02875 [Ruminococcus sp.]|jgi:hypothetical protein|nr:hypothetical protein [Ruminococcus sp.]
MTRENLKNEIDLIPDSDLDAFVSVFNAFQTRFKTESENRQCKKIPEVITSISDLMGTLPPDIDLDEMRMKRILGE